MYVLGYIVCSASIYRKKPHAKTMKIFPCDVKICDIIISTNNDTHSDSTAYTSLLYIKALLNGKHKHRNILIIADIKIAIH